MFLRRWSAVRNVNMENRAPDVYLKAGKRDKHETRGVCGD